MTDFTPLTDLYKRMDDCWDDVARSYAFECSGCEDNCCQSLFFHHTHIEHDFLRHGFKQLPAEQQRMMLQRAKDYCTTTFADSNTSESLKILCPVNEGGQCRLYPYRPMICRLHGLPHELNRPGFETLKSPGCDAGYFDSKPYVTFDRTPFYQQMAQVEMAYRQAENRSGKLKMTVAHILLSE